MRIAERNKPRMLSICITYDHTEAEMIADMAYRAEKHMLDDRGPLFVLRIYFATGEYRHEIHAMQPAE
jgi:hypothetical protein